MGVKPGECELAVDPQILAALRVTAEPLRLTLRPTAAGVAASGLELRPKPTP
ncbi:MAG TPA: hypothetical protein VH158_02725 [Gemmatimonadales bacterium]|jgi:hypothetical protein|nr:hypothetical protein [Gemmatimonadales bacterium]